MYEIVEILVTLYGSAAVIFGVFAHEEIGIGDIRAAVLHKALA